jgi:hypothetical protein
LAGVEVEMGRGTELVVVSVGGVCIGRFNDSMIGVVVTGDDVGGCTRVIAGALAGVEVEMGRGTELVVVSVGGVCIGT